MRRTMIFVLALALLVVFAISAGAYELVPVVSYTLGDSIISAEVLDVAGEPVIIARCISSTKLIAPDGTVTDLPIASDIDAKFVSCGDSIVAFVHIPTHLTDFTWLEAAVVYPYPGATSEMASIPFAAAEWFPMKLDISDNIVILATLDISDSDDDGVEVTPNRDWYLLEYPEMDTLFYEEGADIPYKIISITENDRFAILCYDPFLDCSPYLGDGYETIYYNSYRMILYDLSFIILSRANLGKSGDRYEEWRREGYTFESTEGYYTKIGISKKDFDGDLFEDIPFWKKITYDHVVSYSHIVFGSKILGVPPTIDFLYYGCFFPNEAHFDRKALILGETYYRGEHLDSIFTFDGWLPKYSALQGFYDIDDDGFDELYGWWGDTLQFFKCLPGDKITESDNLPDKSSISVYPNPFNSSVKITIFDGRGLACQTPTDVEIYDLQGHIVATLYPNDVPLSRGTDQSVSDGQGVIWQPDQTVPSGIYLVSARLGATTYTKRIVYLK